MSWEAGQSIFCRLPFFRILGRVNYENYISKINIDWKNIDEDDYCHTIQALQGISEICFSNPVTIFDGENGTGKSTLMDAIADCVGFNLKGGSLNFIRSESESSKFAKNLKITRGVRRPKDGFFFRSDNFFAITELLDTLGNGHDKNFWKGYGGESLTTQSHGEGFLSLFQNRLRGNGLYLLDEPEAALSPQHQLTLLYEIQRLVTNHSQFIIATHSPIILGMPNAAILSFNNRLQQIPYEETESYRITSLFINNKDLVLRELLDFS